jgi:hypothetical protein
LLCQSGRKREKIEQNVLKTVCYEGAVRVNRNGDMSSQCRQFRTSIMTALPKWLIAYDSTDVAEGRQHRSAASPANNKSSHRTADAVMAVVEKHTGAGTFLSMEPNCGPARVGASTDDSRFKKDI